MLNESARKTVFKLSKMAIQGHLRVICIDVDKNQLEDYTET